MLTQADLDGTRAEALDAERADVDGWSLWATPAPTHGASLLEAMVGAGGAVDPATLLSAVLAATAARRARIGDGGGTGTSMVSAADRHGNAVVIVHSNSYPRFGSGLVVEDYDLILNNRAGRGFSADPLAPNFPSAGARPPTTLHAWSARRTGGPLVLGGTPGGANQVAWNAQLLAMLLGGEDEPGKLVTAPRWEWRPSDGGLTIEAGFDPIDVGRLAAATPVPVEHVDRWSLRCAQQVLVVPDGEPAIAAADPRTVGAALPA